jgi:hypothetical protein
MALRRPHADTLPMAQHKEPRRPGAPRTTHLPARGLRGDSKWQSSAPVGTAARLKTAGHPRPRVVESSDHHPSSSDGTQHDDGRDESGVGATEDSRPCSSRSLAGAPSRIAGAAEITSRLRGFVRGALDCADGAGRDKSADSLRPSADRALAGVVAASDLSSRAPIEAPHGASEKAHLSGLLRAPVFVKCVARSPRRKR